MKASSICTIVLSVLMAACNFGCAPTIIRCGIQRVGYNGVVAQHIGKMEQVKSYLDTTMNGRRLRDWNIKDANGNVVGIYAEGRPYGMHFYEMTTDKRFLDGNSQDGPANIPENLSTERR